MVNKIHIFNIFLQSSSSSTDTSHETYTDTSTAHATDTHSHTASHTESASLTDSPTDTDMEVAGQEIKNMIKVKIKIRNKNRNLNMTYHSLSSINNGRMFSTTTNRRKINISSSSQNLDKANIVKNKIILTKMEIIESKNVNNKGYFKRFLIGVKKGWSIDTLPPYLLKLQLHPLIRIFRVIGGLSVLSLLSTEIEVLGIYAVSVATFISFVYGCYMLYITVKRFKHIYYLLQSEETEVRNSPLDTIASFAAKWIVCAKVVFDSAAPAGIALGLLYYL